jgi:hypothetical protein
MKPIASNMTEIDNIEGEEIAFGISAANAGWVMRSMADLYSNRELAVVREYSTNARDAMIEAGNGSEPIEVRLPSAMNPYFEVRDFGIGMSEETLKRVYTQFGESTKRDSDDFNGMLGFGSKSAMAYTNTFTIEAVKDGIKTIAIISRKEDFRIVLKIVMRDLKTNERDGVKIQVPVHNWSTFTPIANDFYKYWIPGTVMVNGKIPEWAAGEKIDDNLYYSKGDTSYVVMGNVAYRINNPRVLFPSGMNQFNFVAYVPNGAIEFVPSREDLKYSEHTKRALHALINDLAVKIVSNAEREIKSAKDHAEAFQIWYKWRRIVGQRVDDLVYKGDKLIHNFNIEGYCYDKSSSYSRGATNFIRNYPIEKTNNTIIITDFVANLSSAHKAKVKAWMQIKQVTANYIIFTQQDKVVTPWFDPARVVSWERVKAEAPKAPSVKRPASNNPGRLAGTFDLISRKGRSYEKDVPIVVPPKKLFYIMVVDYNRDQSLARVLDEFNMDDQVVLVGANRKDKFLRNYGHAENIVDYLESQVNFDGPSLISKDGDEFMKIDSGNQYRLARMDEKRVDDPELVRLIKLVKVGQQAYLKDYNRQHRLASLLGKANKFKKYKYDDYNARKNEPLAKMYPLAMSLSWDSSQSTQSTHGYMYVNAVYAARKGGQIV